jgi:hypothetical protein
MDHFLGNARVGSLVLAVALITGCGGHYVNRGSDLFVDGRYVEAAEVFERTQDRLSRSDVGEQARYGLYRGATLFVLGDFAHAQSWLAYAYEVERVNPGALRKDDRAFLDRVWLALEARYRGLPPNDSETAVAAGPAAPPASEEDTPSPPSPAPETQRSLVAP